MHGAGHGMSLEEFRSLPDYRVAIRVSQGVRSARPLSATQVEVVLGVTAASGARDPAAYRIISFQDDNYAYEKFVRPAAARLLKQVECRGVAGAPFAKFERTIVTLDLPFPMREDTEYHVLAQGTKGPPLVSTHTAQGFVYRGDAAPPVNDNSVDLAVLGLRRVEPVGPALIMLDFGANFGTGPGSRKENYTVRVNGKTVPVLNLGRRTMVDTYRAVGWPFKAIPEHKIFLELGRPFDDGDTVEVAAAESVTLAGNTAAFRFDAKKTLSNSIKVNQVGYLTDSPVKIGYLGRWMGSFPEGKGGNPALLFEEAPEFHVCAEKTGRIAFTGIARLVHESGKMDEGAYKCDHSGENVYWLDFTAFRMPGRYFLSVPRVGRSLPFEIGDAVYDEAFQVMSHGVYTQRCGIELGPPHTEWRRIACHRKGIVATTLSRHGGEGGAHKNPGIHNRVDPRYPKPLAAYGGHHDAGDYNPRSHIDVAYTLMDAYEMAPQKFRDGQLAIPERNNGIPDILDEAYWAMRLWLGLQDRDGGVWNGTESNGDPNFIQSVELDPLGDYAFAKDSAGSFTFAAVMAQASRLWKSVGKTREAADFLKRARLAYAWAERNRPAKPDARNYLDPKAYAAAEMLHTTGEARFDRGFKEACAWAKDPKADLDVYKKYDQSRAAWAYARCPGDKVDPELQKAVIAAIHRKSDYYIADNSTMAYRFIRHPYAPINWGTGALLSHLKPVLWSYHLTGERKYLEWIVRSCDNSLGANPMNLVWTVGIGTRTVRAPLHNSRYSHMGEVVKGQQVEGPHHDGAGYRVKEVAYPKINKKFANLQTFCDNHWCIAMDEGVVPRQAECMAVFGLMLPDPPSKHKAEEGAPPRKPTQRPGPPLDRPPLDKPPVGERPAEVVTPVVSEAARLYVEAETLLIDGRFDEAVAIFRRIVDEYPDTSYTEKAKEYLAIME